MHVCQPWTNVPKIHHKTSDPKIFISHICDELCRNSSPCYTMHVSQPILNQCPQTHHKTSDPKICISHICVELCRNSSLYYTPHVCKTSDPKNFISHIPLLNFCGVALHITPCMCANPEPMFQRYTTKPQTLRFSSHTSVLNFAGTALHVTPCMWANPSWTNVPRHTTKPQTPRFASHTSVLNFAGTALYIIPHMCAKPQTLRISSHTSLFWTFVEQLSILHHACVPTLNQCSKIHHKTSDPKIFISHICAELCRNSSPCYTMHVGQPILNQCSKDTPQNLRPQDLHLTHLCWTLPEQLSILYPTCVQNLRP